MAYIQQWELTTCNNMAEYYNTVSESSIAQDKYSNITMK